MRKQRSLKGNSIQIDYMANLGLLMDPEQKLNILPKVHIKEYKYFRVSGLSISPDNKKLAFGVDTLSRRIYTIKIKDLTTDEMYSDNIDVNSLKKEIAKLNLEIKNNNDFTSLFDKTMLEIINLRNKFRSEEKYSESDDIRDLLDELNIVIEDNKTGSSWKFKGQ